MVRGNFTLTMTVTVDGGTVNDTLRKAQEIAQYLEERNILVALDKVETIQPKSIEVYVEEIPEQKIRAIKEVRAFTGIGLKEAKDFVEGQSILLTLTEFERFKSAMALVGLTVKGRLPGYNPMYASAE